MRTQVLNWMNKGTTKSLSALCMNKGQRESVRSCCGSEIQQGSYESIHQAPGAEVKTIQRLLLCWVLWAQGQCSIEAPGTGAGGGPGRGRWQTVCSLTHLTLSWVWVWCRVGDVLTLSQTLGYSSKKDIAHRLLIKLFLGEESNEELNFGMLLTQKLMNNT